MSKNKILHQEIPTDWDNREKLREKGQFWTPPWVAQAMVSYVLKDSTLVFDPATGMGAFFDALRDLDPQRRVHYYGTDIDPEVLNSVSYQNQKNCKIEINDFILATPNRKFKAIVANPPYIRHHRLSQEMKSKFTILGNEIVGSKLDGRAGLHIFFLIQALQLLENDGRLAFILPADTCEGVFAKKLWDWISTNFCIEAVITFKHEATPFPNVDTNAIIILIKKTRPRETVHWVQCLKSYSEDLLNWIVSDFEDKDYSSLTIIKRQLNEAISTGLSREPSHETFKYKLKDFANVMRGIATGANEFFFLTKEQVNNIGIEERFLKRVIGRTSDLKDDIVSIETLSKLEKKGRPTYLLSLDGHEIEELPIAIREYIKFGESQGYNNRALIKTRNPWYKMEKREIPPYLFAYLGRRNLRFIENKAGLLPLTGFLCIYPKSSEKEYLDKLGYVLNHPLTIENLRLVGKSYGGGALKVEPKPLQNLPIPDFLGEELIAMLKQIKQKK